MAKLTDGAAGGNSVRQTRVTVQLVASADEPQAKVAIALPKDPPPSNYIPMGSHVSTWALPAMESDQPARAFSETNHI